MENGITEKIGSHLLSLHYLAGVGGSWILVTPRLVGILPCLAQWFHQTPSPLLVMKLARVT